MNNNNKNTQGNHMPSTAQQVASDIKSINGLPRISLYDQRRFVGVAPAGFVGHWYNDKGDRLSKMLRSGWSFTEGSDYNKSTKYSMSGTDLESVNREAVGVKPDGSPAWAYYMIKPEAWHKEDRANGVEKENAAQLESIDPSVVSGGVFDGNNVMRVTKS